MKRVVIIMVMVLGFVVQGWGQEEERVRDTYFDSLYTVFMQKHQEYEKLVANFTTHKNSISLDSLEERTKKLSEIKVKTKSLVKELDSLKKQVLASEVHYGGLKVNLSDSIVKKIEDIKIKRYKDIITKSSGNIFKVFNYYGDHLVVDIEELNLSKTNSEIIQKLLSETNGKSYLGDVIIPKDEQEFHFYEYCSYSQKINQKYIVSKVDKYKFKKISIEIRDGNFADIKAYVKTKDGNLHIFENQIGVSLLRFSTYGKNNYLFYKHTITHPSNSSEDNYSESKMRKFYIKLSDVMVYDYKIGQRYVPNNLVLELPVKEEENRKSSALYQIKEKTELDKVVELRAYTDFLSLFGDSNNGLIQIEGKANFFVYPFPYALFGNANLMEIEFAKQLSPYVNYSRFDDELRYFEFPEYGKLGKNDALGLLEKRYLIMGLEANLLQLSSKDFPFSAILNANLSYQLTEALIEDNRYDLKGVGYGPGIKLVFRRFNNFGFTYNASFSWYDYGNFNGKVPVESFPKFRVFSNEIEINYHPSGNSNQSVFIRLRTFNNSEPNADDAFYHFQFGYKFAIGNRTINK